MEPRTIDPGPEQPDAVVSTSTMPDFDFLTAWNLAASGNTDEAEAILCRGGRLPSSVESVDLLARIAVQKGQFQQARRLWKAVLEKDPSHESAKAALTRLGSPWMAAALTKRIAFLAGIAVVLCLSVFGLFFVLRGVRQPEPQVILPLRVTRFQSTPSERQLVAKAETEPQKLVGKSEPQQTPQQPQTREAPPVTFSEQQPVEKIHTVVVTPPPPNPPSDQVTVITQQLDDLQRELSATKVEFASLHEQTMLLEAERNALSRRFNDFDQLQSQIRLVKQRLWEKRVADRKKASADSASGGNAGVLLKDGHWQSTKTIPALGED
jgi:hypothetical protein